MSKWRFLKGHNRDGTIRLVQRSGRPLIPLSVLPSAQGHIDKVFQHNISCLLTLIPLLRNVVARILHLLEPMFNEDRCEARLI
jgi:hypothetical protein